MAHGKTLEIQKLDAQMFWSALARAKQNPRETRNRDRSLNSKARIRARKAANRAA